MLNILRYTRASFWNAMLSSGSTWHLKSRINLAVTQQTPNTFLLYTAPLPRWNAWFMVWKKEEEKFNMELISVALFGKVPMWRAGCYRFYHCWLTFSTFTGKFQVVAVDLFSWILCSLRNQSWTQINTVLWEMDENFLLKNWSASYLWMSRNSWKYRN